MNELLKFWTSRTFRQRLAICGGFALSFLLMLAFIALAGRVPMALLYSGLDDVQAAPIVTHLEQSGIRFEIRNGSIWVDEAQRDRVRMDLAGQNLPQMGGAGYEILDKMSGFSTTSQMFDAAYWRAKEGELARTILSIPTIRSARVHLTVPQSRGYRRGQPGAASVTVVTDGTPVSPAQASAMRFLIASAVPELTADDVSVIDSARGLISPPDDQNSADREAQMKANVERILSPHVGAGNAIVELSIELVTQSEQLVERSIDPAQRAMISEESEELTDESSSVGDAPVTAASNLPEQSGNETGKQTSQRAETRQRSNYEFGGITRQIERQPGAIRRLSVAVLVREATATGEDGTPAPAPRTEDELSAIRDLVAAAVGYDEERGDELIVRSMPFVANASPGTEIAQTNTLFDRLAVASLAKLALVGVFAIIAMALTLRAIRRTAPGTSAVLDTTAPLQVNDFAMSDGSAVDSEASQDMNLSNDLPMLSMAAADFDFDTPDTDFSDSDPIERLKRLMRDRQEETVRLLNGWIGADDRPTT
ncbi:flagellar basal-body MS-ring/collar protein FliF [Paracoccus albus]|uniref:flagellar basal-body MS-ring/collar protein FliF n=1 Tax=Paracoccus albus TaxID=3017784 RepID=UPI0022F07C3C|nr:flagellar basal-body MS-ring/collar protein FliF [Paracoccus albus]WBU60207.1 flagellar basal-body MS-ring/collar protein FliF [Paracoccus albus]